MIAHGGEVGVRLPVTEELELHAARHAEVERVGRRVLEVGVQRGVAVGESKGGLQGVVVVVVELDALRIGVAVKEDLVRQRDVDRQLALGADRRFLVEQFLILTGLDGKAVGELVADVGLLVDEVAGLAVGRPDEVVVELLGPGVAVEAELQARISRPLSVLSERGLRVLVEVRDRAELEPEAGAQREAAVLRADLELVVDVAAVEPAALGEELAAAVGVVHDRVDGAVDVLGRIGRRLDAMRWRSLTCSWRASSCFCRSAVLAGWSAWAAAATPSPTRAAAMIAETVRWVMREFLSRPAGGSHRRAAIVVLSGVFPERPTRGPASCLGTRPLPGYARGSCARPRALLCAMRHHTGPGAAPCRATGVPTRTRSLSAPDFGKTSAAASYVIGSRVPNPWNAGVGQGHPCTRIEGILPGEVEAIDSSADVLHFLQPVDPALPSGAEWSSSLRPRRPGPLGSPIGSTNVGDARRIYTVFQSIIPPKKWTLRSLPPTVARVIIGAAPGDQSATTARPAGVSSRVHCSISHVLRAKDSRAE